MTAKMKRFADFYLGQAGLNATRAARLAKYAHPNKQGPELTKHPAVKAYIDARMDEEAMGAGEILYRLTRHASNSAEAIFDFGDEADGESPTGLVRVDLRAVRDAGLLDQVKKFKCRERRIKSDDGETIVTEAVYEVEFYNSQAALDKLARCRGLYKDNIHHSGSIDLSGQALERAANKGKGRAKGWRKGRGKGKKK